VGVVATSQLLNYISAARWKKKTLKTDLTVLSSL
jgi:hypothetical protein